MTRQANERRMRTLVARWRSSEGLGPAAFARRHGLSIAKFGYWRRRLQQPEPTQAAAPVEASADRAEPAVEFRPVHLFEAEARLEVVLATGDRFLVPETASAGLLAAVVAALRSRC